MLLGLMQAIIGTMHAILCFDVDYTWSDADDNCMVPAIIGRRMMMLGSDVDTWSACDDT